VKFIILIFLFVTYSCAGQTEIKKRKIDLELSFGENRLLMHRFTEGSYPYSFGSKGGWETNASISIGFNLKNWRISVTQSVGTIKLHNQYQFFDFDTIMYTTDIKFRTAHLFTGLSIGRKFNFSEVSNLEIGLGLQYSFFKSGTQSFDVFQDIDSPPLDLEYVEITTSKIKFFNSNLSPVIYLKWNQKINKQWFGLSLIYGQRNISYQSYWHTDKRYSLQLDRRGAVYKYIGLQLSYQIPFSKSV
jgi:hypothetical protein